MSAARGQSPSLHSRLVRALLPPELMASHGPDIERLFNDLLSNARPRGRLALARTWLLELRGLCGLWLELRRERRDRAAALALQRRLQPSSENQSMVSSIGSDLRFGLRWMMKRPLFSVVTVLTLALGVGVTPRS